MAGDTSMPRAFAKYVASLLLSLGIATVAVLPFEESPEPGTLPRLVAIVVFFSVFTLLFLWDAGYLGR
jgi:hypothetical protein